MGFRFEDIVTAGRLTTDPASPLQLAPSTPATLSPPIANPKAVRLLCNSGPIYVETAPAGETPADPTAGSLRIRQCEHEYIPLEPGSSVRVSIEGVFDQGSVLITWLS